MCWRVLSRGAFALLFVAAGCTTVSRPARSDACWLSAYAETGYRGAMTTYTGPTYETSLMKDAASLALGPRARFEGFGDPDYENETLVLGPGTRVPDLLRLNFPRRVSSFKLDCVG
jgi:hypothetical protein